MAVHEIKVQRETLHGTFCRDIEPILTINSGDVVRYETLDAGWNIEAPLSREERTTFEPRDPELDAGHALCGPVAIRGLQPGMTLEVRINTLRPGPWGWNGAGGADIERFQRLGIVEEGVFMRWNLDRDAMIATNQFGHSVAMRPFLGVMGMPPAEPGHHRTSPPRVTGGNLDCRELVAGTTLFLPVAVEGGLFSPGDGHAAQGDGEVSGTAIECHMELAELTFVARDDLQINAPRAWTPDAWLTLGVAEDLDDAVYMALNEMLDLIQTLHAVNRPAAVALASTAVDLRVTQIVNGVQGVHAVLPHGAIR